MFHVERYFTILLCLMFLPGRAHAGADISLSTGSGHPGDEVEVTVTLSGMQNVTAVQIEIPLTTTLNYIEGSVTLDGSMATHSHTVSASQSTGRLKIYVYSLSLETFKGNAGPLLTFRLSLGKEPGTYELTPNAILSQPDGSSVAANVIPGNLIVYSPKIQLSSTAIHFGSVPIRSSYEEQLLVTNLGNEPLIVSGITSSLSLFSVSPSTFTLPAGSQQPITIFYAPSQYGIDNGNITINSNAVNGAQRISVDASPYSVNILSLADASGLSDEEATLHVNLQNMEPIVATQCRITLPVGVTFVEGSTQLNSSRSANHQITTHAANDWVDFYLHSSNNVALLGNEGELYTFRVKLGATGGTYPLVLSNVLLSNLDGKDMTSSVADASLRIAAPRLESDTTLDFGEVPMEDVAKRYLTIHNTGEQPLNIQRIEFSNPAFHLSASTTLPTIQPGDSRELTIFFEPNGEQQIDATMQIYCNDPDNRMHVVNLKACSYPTNQLSLEGHPAGDQSEDYVLNINLQNSTPIVAAQFDIHWIADMSTATELLTLSLRSTNHQIALNRVDETTFRVFIYSADNAAILPGDGPLLSIIYNKVSPEVDYNLSTILVDNIVLSSKEELNRASSVTSSLLVGGLMGDANGNGSVTVTDVVSIVEHLLQRQPSPFIHEQADVNMDGEITIIDIVEVINLIMHQNHQ